MEQRTALRVYIHDGSLAKREESIHFIVVAGRTEFENGRIIVDNLHDISYRTWAYSSGSRGDETAIAMFTYPGIPCLLRDQYVVHK